MPDVRTERVDVRLRPAAYAELTEICHRKDMTVSEAAREALAAWVRKNR